MNRARVVERWRGEPATDETPERAFERAWALAVLARVFGALEADYAAAFKGRDPSQFASNFKPLDIERCAACHVSEAAGDNCTMCHNYHVGDVATDMPGTRIDTMLERSR